MNSKLFTYGQNWDIEAALSSDILSPPLFLIGQFEMLRDLFHNDQSGAGESNVFLSIKIMQQSPTENLFERYPVKSTL